MFYSKTTNGFYAREIHGDNIPADAVEITEAEHAALLDGQSMGKVIVADESGHPILQDPPPLTVEELADMARVKRDALLTACDWTQVADAPVDQAAWRAYRQALRDVPEQAGFPTEITWPVVPA